MAKGSAEYDMANAVVDALSKSTTVQKLREAIGDPDEISECLSEIDDSDKSWLAYNKTHKKVASIKIRDLSEKELFFEKKIIK